VAEDATEDVAEMTDALVAEVVGVMTSREGIDALVIEDHLVLETEVTEDVLKIQGAIESPVKEDENRLVLLQIDLDVLDGSKKLQITSLKFQDRLRLLGISFLIFWDLNKCFSC